MRKSVQWLKYYGPSEPLSQDQQELQSSISTPRGATKIILRRVLCPRYGVLILSAPNFSGDTGAWWGLEWPLGPRQPSLNIAASQLDIPTQLWPKSHVMPPGSLPPPPISAPSPVPLSQDYQSQMSWFLVIFLIYYRYSNSTAEEWIIFLWLGPEGMRNLPHAGCTMIGDVGICSKPKNHLRSP